MTNCSSSKMLQAIGAIFILVSSASASSSGGMSWKEEVLLHDGRAIIVHRSQTYGGRTEIGQSPPIKELRLSFKLPGSDKTISWTSEYGEDLGRTNFKLLALHVYSNVPYLVAAPNLCLSYNKWGRPNPPYVIFKYDAGDWRRVDLKELPADFQTTNLTIDTLGEKATIASQPLISAALVESLNKRLEQPEYRSILRDKLTKERINEMCEERVFYKGYWVLPNDPVARKLIDQKKR